TRGELCNGTHAPRVPRRSEMHRYAVASARFFFFSSRRRHTRCLRDWSSDVCSSDLVGTPVADASGAVIRIETTAGVAVPLSFVRSEEHTSELQSLRHLVCRLLLEKKKKKKKKK